MSARYIVGDSLTVLRSLPDASVDLVLTSPPFLALRSYLPADHPDKGREVGTEAGPGEFIDTLVSVIEECRRVLAPHGSLVFELGDTYSGSGGAGGDYNEGGLRDGEPKFKSQRKVRRTAEGFAVRDDNPRPNRNGRRVRSMDDAAGILAPRSRPGPDDRDAVAGWPMDKSLCLVPELLRLTLAYGCNPLTGRTTAPWRIRNVIRWCRPNPPVGALADKFRPATSDMLVACVDRRRYFDLDAVRTPGAEPERDRDFRYGTEKDHHEGIGAPRQTFRNTNPGGAPPLDWWEISTEPYKGSHYAVWPTALLTRPILAMCPQRVCTTCGEPSRRIVDAEQVGTRRVGEALASKGISGGDSGNANKQRHIQTTTTTTGWTDCGHDDWRAGVVLDPFAGSGTTLSVATGHGRDAIGIDLDERNADLAEQRVGMWLTVEHFAAEVAS